MLARKYRPSDFSQLIGQDALVRTLRHAFERNRVPHALLLSGVRGVGKTTTARIIARALNCIGPDGTGGPTVAPCGVCPECRAILADRHPDVLELDAASNRGIDDVRELREMLRFRPAQGRYKVMILDEAHMLTGPAFNALLKTLEEPPPQVVFMLATTELRSVPVTIRSRCQTHHLKRVPQAQLVAHFAAICAAEHVDADPEALGMIARAAEGSVRDGLSLLDQAIAQAGRADGPAVRDADAAADGSGTAVTTATVRDMLGLADRGLTLALLEAALRGDLPTALGLADRAHTEGADPGVLLNDLLGLVHTLTRFVASPSLRDDPALEESLRVRGAALAAMVSVPVLGRAWQVLLKGVGELAGAPDRHAAADMVLIRLAHVAGLPTPGELLRRLQDGAGRNAAGQPAGPAMASSPNGRAQAPAAEAGANRRDAAASAFAGNGVGTAHDGGGAAVENAALVAGRTRVHSDGAHGATPVPPRSPAVQAGASRATAFAPPAPPGVGPTGHLAPAATPSRTSPSGPVPMDGWRTGVAAHGQAALVARPEPAPARTDAAAEEPRALPPADAGPRTWPEIVALASGTLHSFLRQCVHPVALAPGRIEIRVTPDAPRDLAAQLAAVLQARTGSRWTVVLSNAAGDPTLDTQGESAAAARLAAAARHPLVVAVLAAFPGTTIAAVRDAATDAFGLLPAHHPEPLRDGPEPHSMRELTTGVDGVAVVSAEPGLTGVDLAPMDAVHGVPANPDEPDETED